MVVVGLDCPTGLQSARVFAARGVEVVGLAADPGHPCARTRTCRRVLRIDPGPHGTVATLLRLGADLGERAVLLPCTDRSVLEIARHKTELSPLYGMAVPSADVIELLMDKARFASFAAAHALPIPRTCVVRDMGDAVAAASEIGYPCILKPSIKSAAWSTNTSVKALRVESREALLRLYEQYAAWADAFVVQEWIAGVDSDHYTCDCYVSAQGDALATFCSRKIRQWPPGVGQGCLSVEHRNDIVLDTTLRVLRAAGHHGQGYLEMKRDARSGRHLIVEANVGRPTGRAAAAEKAGVELLMTMYCDVVGAPLPVARAQTFRGTKWIHERRDLQACAHLLLTRRARLRDVVGTWRGPFAFALFSFRDPVPFLADWLRAPAQALARQRLFGDRSTPDRTRTNRSPSVERAPNLTRVADGRRAAPPVPARADVVDLDIHGILGVRAHDARPTDLAAIAHDLGPTATACHALVPDVVVRFVDDLPSPRIELVDDGFAFGEGGLFSLGPEGEPLAHLTLGEPWGSALIVCRRGLSRVPFLSTAVDLAALANEWIPLHASGWTTRGMGVLAAGCGDSGKTGALLAACQHGGIPLADDRILMSADGSSMIGLGQAMSLKERHVAQLSLSGVGVGSVRRTFARAATALEGFAEPVRPAMGNGRGPVTGSAKRMLRRARRRLAVQVSLERLGRVPGASARPDVVILLETHASSRIAAEQVTPEDAACRLSADVVAELTPALHGVLASAPSPKGNDRVVAREAVETAARLLRQATRLKPCYIVRHPRRCRLDRLHQVIDALVPGAPTLGGDPVDWAGSVPDACGSLAGEVSA